MKSILIIVANPKEGSLSFVIAQRYKNKAIQKGERVEMLDLYRDEHQQPFFDYEDDPYEREATPAMLYYQEKITKADEIVFVFPYWWGSMPAILKNFFDWNFSMGFAAVFENGRPKGLLTDKSVKVFVTTGTPSWLYTITGANRRLRGMFKEQIFDFCGMKMGRFKIFGGVDSGKVDIEKILKEVR